MIWKNDDISDLTGRMMMMMIHHNIEISFKENGRKICSKLNTL